ncbi:HAMP domain-containing sensor histidine kinase [Tessaracoccus sp. Z1128]
MTAHRKDPRLARLALAPRLLLNNLLVILAGAGTVLVVVLLVTPSVFQLHLDRAGVAADSEALQHILMAIQDAVLVAVGIGVAAAAFTAATISWVVARRLAAPVRDAADTSRRLAHGDLDARVLDPRMGPEFATLAASVNELAERLQATETTRRALTADLAHQLRTPIASIEATIEAVRDDVLPADHQTWDTLAAQSARLRRLVADLEVVSRAEERQLLLSAEPVPVPTMIHAAVAAHSERYRSAGVRIDASLADSTPRVLVDPERIQEVLGSLLDNALRCTPAGGTVTIAGRPSPSGDSAVITVTDNGLGLTPAETGQIFRRFAKAADSPGSGLGLTIARAIVEAHHGTLTADSAGPGTGARFTITLPASGSRRTRH